MAACAPAGGVRPGLDAARSARLAGRPAAEAQSVTLFVLPGVPRRPVDGDDAGASRRPAAQVAVVAQLDRRPDRPRQEDLRRQRRADSLRARATSKEATTAPVRTRLGALLGRAYTGHGSTTRRRRRGDQDRLRAAGRQAGRASTARRCSAERFVDRAGTGRPRLRQLRTAQMATSSRAPGRARSPTAATAPWSRPPPTSASSRRPDRHPPADKTLIRQAALDAQRRSTPRPARRGGLRAGRGRRRHARRTTASTATRRSSRRAREPRREPVERRPRRRGVPCPTGRCR